MFRRPRALTAFSALVLALAFITAAFLVQPNTRQDQNVLYQAGVGLDSSGKLAVIPPGQHVQFLLGTRVIAPTNHPDEMPAARALARQMRDWLSAGSIPGTNAGYGDLATTALYDLKTLSTPTDAVIAGPSRAWRYVWPRDASFAAAAFTATGHLDDAIRILDFLQRVQSPDGSFQARYLPDGSGVPDSRGVQTDGTAWSLWALNRLVKAAATESAGPTQTELLNRYQQLLTRSQHYLMVQSARAPHLPLASADYWERQESHLTLGTAAPVLTGLVSAANLQQLADQPELAKTASHRADQVREAITNSFSSSGYGRYPGRTGVDAAISFTLPPFQERPFPGAKQSWLNSMGAMSRPGGGLAPGTLWSETTMSWTPETALYALTAASNSDPDLARNLVDWISTHRTDIGAIPEKVGPDGSPAHVAPLAWSDSLVILTLSELDKAA